MGSDLYILDISQIVVPSDPIFITIYNCVRVIGNYCYLYMVI
jgi:hypothetical protein